MLLANELLKPTSVNNVANDVVWPNWFKRNQFETGLSASVNLKCLSCDLAMMCVCMSSVKSISIVFSIDMQFLTHE